uniref:Uncharacterized protein n=1 Tax=Pipistrellus kuhlii TaxID=59472 RepID=A0A7J7SUP6_PIPKU|nr:hypothetical protein mPipKuh1_009777 [Pipistrellus kuhlii]
MGRKQERNGQHLHQGRSRRDKKDKDNIESACKERSFSGRLVNILNTIHYSIFLAAAPESPVPVSAVQPHLPEALPSICRLPSFRADRKAPMSNRAGQAAGRPASAFSSFVAQ